MEGNDNRLLRPQDIEVIDGRYAPRLEEEEDWAIVGYESLESQLSRFSAFERVYEDGHVPPDASILDVGCGTGSYYRFVRERHGEPRVYTGVDILDRMVEKARETSPRALYPNVRFVKANILEDDSVGVHDLVVNSGALTPVVGDNDAFIRAMVSRMSELSRRVVAFDFLSDLTDPKEPDLYYYNLDQVIGMCHDLFGDTMDMQSMSSYHHPSYHATVFLIRNPQTSGEGTDSDNHD